MATSNKIVDHYGKLDWTHGDAFHYPNMVRIPVAGDGSCFFHAICRAFSVDYISEQYHDKDGQVHKITKGEFVRGLRNELADKLEQPVDPEDPDSPIYYDIINRGGLREFAASDPSMSKYSLSTMQTELRSGSAVDYV